MSNFNYMPVSPWSNPAGGIEKTTNELPVKEKATTKTRKRATKKAAKKTAKKTKKAEKAE